MCLDKPLISVIVPAYNAQNTIERCVDSILNQTFQDLELIVIDDGSTDDTRYILEHYMTKDVRLAVITQKNAGVSVARNAGISQATGKWITFVDADDYLELNCLETVLLNDDIGRYDLVFWNYYRVKPDQKELSTIFQHPKGKYSVDELLPYVLDNKGKTGLSSVCCRLFRRELILKYKLLFREEVISNEDRIFMIDYLTHSEQCFGVAKCLYNRTLNANSAMHRWHQNAKDEYLLAARLLKDRLLYYEIWNICKNAFYMWILQDIVSLYLETNLCHLQNTADKKTRKKELQLFINEDLMAESLRQIKYKDLPIKAIIKFIAVKRGLIDILDRWYRHKNYFAY